MVALPQSQHTTAQAIVRWYENKKQEHRAHMGASIIGHPCARFIWLTWRWASTPKFAGRILRLFDTGKREEPRLLEELRSIGVQVWDKDPETDEQWRVSACNGHFGGSLDAVARGLPEAPKTPAVLEFKTHNAKSFADLLAKKLQASKPQHFDQMQIYMGLMQLERGLYLAVNKDTDELYSEWVYFDKEHFEQTIDYAQGLIDMLAPPERISNDPAHWQCKGCMHHHVCHGDAAAEANCRTCAHASPIAQGAWQCTLPEANWRDKTLSESHQASGCGDHLFIPALISFGTAVDGGKNWVAYQHKVSGKHFVNGTEKIAEYGESFTSKELAQCPASLMDQASDLKAAFPGTQVASGGIAWNTPEDLDTGAKAVTKRERVTRSKIEQSLKNLEALHAKTL